MTGPERPDAFTLMRRFRDDDAAVGDALALFVDRPDYGFVWLAYEDDVPVACASVAFGISAERGGLVATLRDLFVIPERRRCGIGRALVTTLRARLERLETSTIEATGPDDPVLAAFFVALGFRAERGLVVTAG